MKRHHYLLLALVIYSVAIYAVYILESAHEASNIKSIGDALWYSIVTLTTVGYGDLYPVTVAGKIIGLFLIIGSMGVLGFLISEIHIRFQNYMEKRKTGYYGCDYKDHYIIIGYNEFSRKVAQQILNANQKVAFLTNDRNQLELINSIYEKQNVYALFTDYKIFENFEKINMSRASRVFINLEADTDSLVMAINIHNNYPRLEIVAICDNMDLKSTFINAGIKYVIAKNEIASKLVASYLFEPHVANYTEDLLTTSVSDFDSDIEEYKILKKCVFNKMPYDEAFYKMKKEYNTVLIGIVKNGIIHKNPKLEIIIEEGDYLILISDGASKNILNKLFMLSEGVANRE
ncbi:MAG: potassium channel family protein [Marinifilaceae bacterium]|jgi:voltage-gated potassium channel|nr:potassium channel family protein [Marinifilaceae bacterium]